MNLHRWHAALQRALSAAPETRVTPGIQPFALRASLRRCQIAPGDPVRIDIETCPICGGAVRIIACSEDPVMIEKSLTHLDAKGAECEATGRPPVRAPSQRRLFDLTG